MCHFKPRDLACVWITPTRRLYLGRWGSPESYERYAEILRRLQAGLEVTETLDPRRDLPLAAPTVGEIVDRYLSHARGYYTHDGEPAAEYENIAGAVRPAGEVYGTLPGHEFGPLCLEALRDQLIERRLARSTINGRTRRIVAMFKWAAAKQLVPASVHQGLTMVAGLRAGRSAAREPAPIQPVDDATVDATLKHLPQVVADAVRVQRYTGARPGEVLAMRPMDVDRSNDVWLYRPASHKTAYRGKSRVVFIGPKAQAILVRYLDRDPDSYCFRPCDSEAQRRADQHAARVTPMSCGNRPGTNRKPSPLRPAGERYKKASYARAIARAAKLAGVEHWTPNQLRHTYATAVRRDHGLEAAQVALGHSGAKVTEVYAERDMAKGAAVARLIG